MVVLIDRVGGRAFELLEDGGERELGTEWLQLDDMAEWQAYRREQKKESGS